jgi:hypothetical protein
MTERNVARLSLKVTFRQRLMVMEDLWSVERRMKATRSSRLVPQGCCRHRFTPSFVCVGCRRGVARGTLV